MNIAATPMPHSSSPTLPRPLQLVDGNLPSPSPLSSSRPPISSPLSSSITSPTSSTSSISTPRRPPNSRRQSSISYFPSSHTRPSPGPGPSPLSPPATASPTFAKSSRRSNSLYIKSGEPISPLLVKANRNSVDSVSENGLLLSPRPVVDHGPLTLTEKHADLLQFIAQKEFKCMELRSQLAVHEAELSQLKRKWERIVSRGMDRAYSNTNTSSSTSPSSHSNSALSHVSLASSALAAPLHLATGNTGVLDGIKGGVQEVGRLIAAGLDLSGSGSSSPSPSTNPTSNPTTREKESHHTNTNGRTSLVRNARHTTTQSVSSVSTSYTTTSNNTSVRLSQSSASSMSLMEDDEICEEPEQQENLSHSHDNDQDEDHTVHPAVVTGNARDAMNADETSPARTSQDGVVLDISISASSETKAAKLVRRRSHDVPKLPPIASAEDLNSPPTSSHSPSALTSPSLSTSKNSSNSNSTSTPRTEPSSKRASMSIRRAAAGMGMAPPAIPGLGLGPLNVAGQPVASWMGSVGKKWEEIQKGETFTKSQKRASLLISDVFAVLSSPSTPNPTSTSTSPSSSHHNHNHTTRPPTKRSQTLGSHLTSHSHTPSNNSNSKLSPAFSPSPLSPSALSSSVLSSSALPSPLSTMTSSSSSVSLLDEDDDDFGGFSGFGESLGGTGGNGSGKGGKGGMQEVLVPTTLPSKVVPPKVLVQEKKELSFDDDDDWNW